MPGVKASSQRSKLVALGSGHRDKAERMAREYGILLNSIYNYQNYDEIAHNPSIDAADIALPNSMHAEYTVRAAQAG
jgi:predicted dehydrogenase